MRFGYPIEITGVEKIVINQTQVWIRRNQDVQIVGGGFFEKVAGGPGFKTRRILTVQEMREKLDYMLDDCFGYRKPAYRAWFSHGTLNVVKNDGASK